MTRTVHVVGSINADDAIRLAHLPRPGETVGARSLTTALGGKGANQAVAAARAGATVRMIGAVGAADGALLVEALEADGIHAAGVARLEEIHSGRAVVLVDDAAENAIVVVPGANHALDESVVRAGCATVAHGDVVLLQHEVPATISRLAARLAHEAGATVLWNAAPAPASRDEIVTDVDVLLVNEHELAAVAALLDVHGDDLESLAVGVAVSVGADVICTLGAAGCFAHVGGVTRMVVARRVDAVDTTAAGDTFAGYLAAAGDLPLDDRLRLALDAATLAVTRPGAAPSIPDRAEADDLAARSIT